MTFNDDSDVKCYLTNVSSESNSLANAINASYGVYYTSTQPNYGLYDAYRILYYDNSSNDKYVVFFTDGANDGDSDYLSTISGYLKKIATVYAVGAGADGSTLSTVASDENHVISASSVTEVANSISGIATTIINESRPKTGKGTVTDYIDSRFQVSDAGGNVLSNGAKVGANGEGTLLIAEDGSQKVVWQDVEIGTGSNVWSDYIYVKAKNTFFGGNKVVTNGPGSNVSITGDKTKYFPQPTVNVKLLDFTPQNNEITLWLGDTIEGVDYSKWLTENTKIPEDALSQIKMSADEISSLITGASVTKDYMAGGETLGSFSFKLSAKDDSDNNINITNHAAEKTGNAVETYYLTITYSPISVSNRVITDTGRDIKDPVGTEVGSVEKIGKYIVNVVTGSLDALKRSTTEDGTLLNGATYKLEKFQNNKWTAYNVLTSGEANIDGTPASDGLMAFNNLGLGLYRLTEVSAPSGFAKSEDVYYIEIERNTEETDKVQYDFLISKNNNIIASWKVDSTVTRDEEYDTNVCTCVMENGVVKAGLNVVDQIAYTLPETGGSGVYVYTIGGILLMIAGALLLYKNKNNKNK